MSSGMPRAGCFATVDPVGLTPALCLTFISTVPAPLTGVSTFTNETSVIRMASTPYAFGPGATMANGGAFGLPIRGIHSVS